jgi:hypothetical protein
VRREHHDDAFARRKPVEVLPLERVHAHPLHEQLEVPAHHIGLGLVPQDQQQQHDVAEQQHRQHGREPSPAPTLEVEKIEERIEEPREGCEQEDGDGERAGDQQVEPRDPASTEADDRGDEQDGGDDAAEDAERDHLEV